MSFLDALEKANQADLDAIDAELANLDKRADALRAARKVLSVRINGKAERAKPGPRGERKAPGGGLTVRQKIVAYLAHAGRGSVSAIAAAIGEEPKSMYAPLNHEFFTKLNDGLWTLTEEGRAAAKTSK